MDCLGDYSENKPGCIKCDAETRDKCKELRAALRGLTIEKLDSGTRQLLIGHMWTIGDALASSPVSDEIRIIMLCEAFMNCFGITELGRTGLMDSELYDKVQELHSDLTDYLHIMKEVYPKCKSDAEFEVLVEPSLKALEEKYSEKTGKTIFGEPTQILRAIKNIFYKSDMYPKIVAQLTTVVSLNASGYGRGFNNQSIPRFRTPQIDGRTK